MTARKLKKIWKTSFLVIALLGGLCIFQVSSFTYYAHQLTSLNSQNKLLGEENSFIKLQLTNKEPVFELEKLAKDLNFEKISQIQYIKATKGPVAAK
ncbi:hypothetical protein J7J24_00095 [bacterium]|nr:hypothetical protein [bacterium]